MTPRNEKKKILTHLLATALRVGPGSGTPRINGRVPDGFRRSPSKFAPVVASVALLRVSAWKPRATGPLTVVLSRATHPPTALPVRAAALKMVPRQRSAACRIAESIMADADAHHTRSKISNSRQSTQLIALAQSAAVVDWIDRRKVCCDEPCEVHNASRDGQLLVGSPLSQMQLWRIGRVDCRSDWAVNSRAGQRGGSVVRD